MLFLQLMKASKMWYQENELSPGNSCWGLVSLLAGWVPELGQCPLPELRSPCLHVEAVSREPEGPSHLFVTAVQLLSDVRLFATPWTAAGQLPLLPTVSHTLLKFLSIELVTLHNITQTVGEDALTLLIHLMAYSFEN